MFTTLNDLKTVTARLARADLNNQVLIALLGFVTTQIHELGLVASQNADLSLEVPENIQKELKAWLEQTEAAKKAWKAYIQ